jgi:hypothetical protein
MPRHAARHAHGSRNGLDAASEAESLWATQQKGDLQTHHTVDIAEVLAKRQARRRRSKLETSSSEGVKNVAVSGQEIGGSSAAPGIPVSGIAEGTR